MQLSRAFYTSLKASSFLSPPFSPAKEPSNGGRRIGPPPPPLLAEAKGDSPPAAAAVAVIVVLAVFVKGRAVVTTDTTSALVRRCVQRYRAGPIDIPWATLTTCKRVSGGLKSTMSFLMLRRKVSSARTCQHRQKRTNYTCVPPARTPAALLLLLLFLGSLGIYER